MKSLFKISIFLLAIVVCFTWSVDKGILQDSLTPHEVIECDNIAVFRRLWWKVFEDLFKNQHYYADLPKGDRKKNISFIRAHQWAPLVLKQAERAGSEKIVAFLRLGHNIKLPAESYGEEDPMNGQKTISVIRVSPLW